jgi:hypothetical protein
MGAGPTSSLVALLAAGCRPAFDPAPYQVLREPVIHPLPEVRVIEVEATGESSAEAAGKAIGLLYRTWYGLDVDHGAPVAPRARWSLGAEAGAASARGRFALPVPDGVQVLTDSPGADGLVPRLATWTYGETAEILHEGSYASEGPTIARLQRTIAARGCEIAGEHEEEYLVGPGMFFRGDPDRYLTIIRYPVRCTPAPGGSPAGEPGGATAG